MKRIPIKRWSSGDLHEVEDLVAEEGLLHLEINEQMGFDTIVSPQKIREFVYGNLFSEGFIDAPSDVKQYLQREKEGNILVGVSLKSVSNLAFRRNYNILWTDCASPSDIQKRMGDTIRKIDSALKVKASDIPLVHKRISDQVDAYRRTGAYHYAFVLNESMDVLSSAFDVSRHNALDKAIGSIFLKNEGFVDKAAFVTGRITSNMIWKCLRAGIPLAMSRSAPFLEAVNLAKKYGLGVIGFMRGNRFNLYCGEKFVDFG